MSILTGPAARTLLDDIGASNSGRRFGLLTSSSINSKTTDGQLMVERLATANAGGYDPERIRAQILAIAETASVDHLVIECDATTHPIAFASLFLPDGGNGQPVMETARLCSVLLAVESKTLLSSLGQGNQTPGVASPCILADQIECADGIVVTGDITGDDFRLSRAVVSALNPRGHIVERSDAAVLTNLLDTRRSFDFEAAFAGAGWRKAMEGGAGSPRTSDGVTTFVYRARRPFYPQKFWNLIQEPFPGVFRAKGFFWLATRMSVVGGLNIAGAECHYSPAGRWWAANVRHDHSDDIEIPDRLRHEWAEPFGDRRQAIAFMGIELATNDLNAQLDACLLDETDMNSDESSWATLPDPFPKWSAKPHDHDCDDHDCCQH